MEVLCSIVIASISIAALFAAFSNGYTILRVTRDDLRATQILTQKTEAVRLLTWQELSNCPTAFQDYFYPPGVTNGTQGTVFYVTITPFGDPTNIPNSVSYRTNIHLITINVAWTNGINQKVVAHHRLTQTMLANDGMQTYIYGTGP